MRVIARSDARHYTLTTHCLSFSHCPSLDKEKKIACRNFGKSVVLFALLCFYRCCPSRFPVPIVRGEEDGIRESLGDSITSSRWRSSKFFRFHGHAFNLRFAAKQVARKKVAGRILKFSDGHN